MASGRRDPSLILALNELNEHKKVYAAIIIIVALSMTIFTTSSAMNEYNEYVVERSISTFYGDGVVMRGGATARQIVSGAEPMTDARQIAEEIEALPGFKATLHAEAEGAGRNDDAIAMWGIDLSDNEEVCKVKDKIVEGEYWDESGNYTQEGMGNPAGPTFLYTPTY
ncbi:MAG: hypothetical protein CVT48_03875, partial [Thermoplasmata archaeon HGW-Thermoplasmata-1]